MKELGVKFKEKREELNIPLEQARNETKIRLSYLKAIEIGNFDEVEREVYLKGFLKIYANYLGLDERKILQEYKKSQQIANREREDEEGTSANDTKKSISDRVKKIVDNNQNKLLYAFITLIIILIIIVVLLLGTVVYKSVSTENSSFLSTTRDYISSISNKSIETKDMVFSDVDLKEPDESNQQQTKAPKGKQTESSNKQVAETKEETKEEIQLKIKAIGDSWIAIEIEQLPVFKGRIKRGETKEFSGKNIKVKISNAAGIKLIKDGQELSSLGKKGEVVVKEYSVESN